VDELTQSCGLTQAEAQLMSKLHKSWLCRVYRALLAMPWMPPAADCVGCVTVPCFSVALLLVCDDQATHV